MWAARGASGLGSGHGLLPRQLRAVPGALPRAGWVCVQHQREGRGGRAPRVPTMAARTAASQPGGARARGAGGALRGRWAAVALVLFGLARSNGTVRDGRGAVPCAPAFVACARPGQRPQSAALVCPLQRARVSAPLSLRMDDASGNRAAEEDRLLWSRRLNRAFLTLGKDPDAWGTDVAAAEDRLLWSRRLARAVSVLYTDPDLVPLDKLWSAEPVTEGRQRSNIRSAVGMLQSEGCSMDDEEGTGMAEAGAGADAGVGAPAPGVVQARECRPKLPTLLPEEELALRNGERVQRQTRNGRVGTGLVVVDVEADVSTAFAVLTDIDRYPERIPTVRAAVTYFRAEKLLKTQFQISKFRLQINTELRCAREASMLEFKMDPERPAPFLNDARGFWFLEPVAVADGDADAAAAAPRTRIWLVADLACSALLPTAIVDYASARALPRATTWLQPVMKDAAGQLPPIPLKGSQGQEVTAGF